MLSSRLAPAAILAGVALIAVGAAVASPALEVRGGPGGDAPLEVSMAAAPALWGGVLIVGTGVPTLVGIGLALAGLANVRRVGARIAFVAAAGALQTDVALMRIAAWDVTGQGLGIAGTRFGLIVMGGAIGVMLLAAAAVRPVDDRRGFAAGQGRSWLEKVFRREPSPFEPEREGWVARVRKAWGRRRSPWV